MMSEHARADHQPNYSIFVNLRYFWLSPNIVPAIFNLKFGGTNSGERLILGIKSQKWICTLKWYALVKNFREHYLFAT